MDSSRGIAVLCVIILVHNAAATSLASTSIPTLPLEYHNGVYLGEVSIGTPPQKFRMVISTASRETWVFARDANTSGYDHQQSSTYKQNGAPRDITYGSNTKLTGRVSSDTFNIAGITIKNQEFVEVSEFESEIIPHIGCDGVLGLSIVRTRQPPMGIFENMVNQGVLAEPKISLHLYKDTERSPAGELILGGVDKRFYEGEIHYAPTSRETGITSTLKMVYYQWGDDVEVTGSSHGPQLMVDSGSTFIAGLKGPVGFLNQHIGANIGVQYNIFAIRDCLDETIKSMPDLYFSFASGKSIKLTPERYIIKLDSFGEEVCITAMKGISEHVWVLGNIFMRDYYTVYDFENASFGFANSKDE